MGEMLNVVVAKFVQVLRKSITQSDRQFHITLLLH
jgi:hypothetical protein